MRLCARWLGYTGMEPCMPLTTSGGLRSGVAHRRAGVQHVTTIGNAIPDTSVGCQHGRCKSRSHRVSCGLVRRWGVGWKAEERWRCWRRGPHIDVWDVLSRRFWSRKFKPR
jgi:hypothetical protein